MALKDIWQQQRQQRKEENRQRKTEVASLLQEMQEQRQQQAIQLSADRDLYIQQLRTETQLYLAQVADDRQAMAANLRQALQQFRQCLQTTSQTLQQDLQADLQLMRVEVQALLDQNRQDRLEMGAQTQLELADFYDRLHNEVAELLTDYAIQREDRAIAVTELLMESQEKRQAEVADLFEQFAQFRQALITFHQELKQSVWGDTASNFVIASEATIAAILDQPDPPVSSKTATAKATLQSNTLEKDKATSSSAEIKNTANAAQPSSATPERPSAIASEPEKSDNTNLSETILTLLAKQKKSRLSEVESALRLSRTEAIQALRQLIQEGRVIQRDRHYQLPS
ncbi:MAG: hypothetical protein VKJ24_15995 [Synechococcales bacterium]|nr:hypothetical protein [Synechococcales bacterium]